jgi:hypothetical protein
MTKSKRVALTLEPALDDVLTELSGFTGSPKTSIINEVLNDALPLFIQVCQAIKEAKKGQAELSLQTTAKFLEEATLMLNQHHLDLGEVKGKYGIK